MLNAKKTSAKNCGSLFAIVDEKIPASYAKRLEEFGFSLIFLEADENIPAPMASHTDMLICRIGNSLIGSRTYFERHPRVFEKISALSGSFDLKLCDTKQGSSYPYDAAFNALAVKDKLFCKSDTASPLILAEAEALSFSIIPVRQGYPACTVLSVGGMLAVTSDAGMKKALEAENIPVMPVPQTDVIKLPPYKNGFIGGCTGVFENKIFFMGNARALPYFDELEARLCPLGYELISLGDEDDSLLDLGGIVFLQK